TPKSPLKPKNISVKTEEERAGKRSAKKSRRVLESSDEEGGRENEETEEEAMEMRDTSCVPETASTEPAESPGVVSPSPVLSLSSQTSPEAVPMEGSPSLSDSGLETPAGIPKRRTARKQLPKRKLQTTVQVNTGAGNPSEHIADDSGESSAKRTKLEENGRTSDEGDSMTSLKVQATAADQKTTCEAAAEQETERQLQEVELSENEGQNVEMEENGGSSRTGNVTECEEPEVEKEAETEPEGEQEPGESRLTGKKQGTAYKQTEKSRKSINSFFAPKKCSSAFEEPAKEEQETPSKTTPSETPSKPTPSETPSKSSTSRFFDSSKLKSVPEPTAVYNPFQICIPSGYGRLLESRSEGPIFGSRSHLRENRGRVCSIEEH
ncbi:uncharacterized protein LOC144490700, partial [Mustelus asterias]